MQVLQKLASRLSMTLPAEASHPTIFVFPSSSGIRFRVEGPLVSCARMKMAPACWSNACHQVNAASAQQHYIVHGVMDAAATDVSFSQITPMTASQVAAYQSGVSAVAPPPSPQTTQAAATATIPSWVYPTVGTLVATLVLAIVVAAVAFKRLRAARDANGAGVPLL